MEKLKIEYTFDLEDFKAMENIEHSYFPNDNITPAEEVFNWYKKNNLTCIGLRNNNNEIIASTIHGEKICKKLLEMDYIRDTSHESKIYCEDGQTFKKAIEKMKRA